MTPTKSYNAESQGDISQVWRELGAVLETPAPSVSHLIVLLMVVLIKHATVAQKHQHEV